MLSIEPTFSRLLAPFLSPDSNAVCPFVPPLTAFDGWVHTALEPPRAARNPRSLITDGPPPAPAQKKARDSRPGPTIPINYCCTKLVRIVFASVWICMIDCPPLTITKFVWARFPVLPLKVAVPVQFELTL